MALAGAQPVPTSDAAPATAERLHRLVEARLDALLPETGMLARSAREAVLSPGKRVRPVLAMLAAAHAGGRAEDALDFGCAVEMVHTASLVLDDLPCMDDATLRRGRPTLHRSVGEDIATLAAIALLNQATRIVLGMDAPAATRLAAADVLTRAIGFDGLAQGQVRDLRDPPEARDAAGLRRLNDLKTGALFAAAVRGGGLCGGASGADLDRLTTFGEAAGFAFQLCDDLLDRSATPDVIGKDVGQDRDSVTFVDIWGEGRVRAAVRQSLARSAEAVRHDPAMTAYVFDIFRHADIGV